MAKLLAKLAFTEREDGEKTESKALPGTIPFVCGARCRPY